MTRYSVVVVAHNHPRSLLAALLHIAQHATPDEILLIDNASSENLKSAILLSRQQVRSIPITQHTSLAAALNAGLDAAANELVLLLHGDVLLQTDVSAAVDWLVNHEDVGVIGGELLSDGAPPRRVLNAGYVVGRGRLAPKPIANWDDQSSTPEIHEVAAVSDACMLVRKCDIRFDERYWFKLEDVDFCYQYAQLGYRVVSMPGLRAIDPGRGGFAEHATELQWMARGLASHLLYHARWRSDLSLTAHPRQASVRGPAALEYLRDVDTRHAIELPEMVHEQ